MECHLLALPEIVRIPDIPVGAEVNMCRKRIIDNDISCILAGVKRRNAAGEWCNNLRDNA
jgi:hypothetical protein